MLFFKLAFSLKRIERDNRVSLKPAARPSTFRLLITRAGLSFNRKEHLPHVVSP